MLEGVGELPMEVFVLQGSVKAVEKISGVHDCRAWYKAMLPSHRSVGIFPFCVEAGGHIGEQGSQVQARSFGLPTETTLVDPAAPGYEELQGLIVDAVLADVIEVAIGTEPVLGLLLPNLFRPTHDPMLSANPPGQRI